MGQSKSGKVEVGPSVEIVNKNVELLFGDLSESNKIESLNNCIILISRNLTELGSFEQKETGFWVNPTLMKCFYHPNFEKTIKNMVTLLAKQLKSIFQTKIIALVSRERFRKALNIANFCIFFTNQNLIQTLNLLSIRSDLDPQTKELIKDFNKDSPEINHQIIESIEKEQLSETAKTFRVSINYMIDLHLKLLTRSDFTLEIIDRLNHSIFVIYVKIFFGQSKEIAHRQSHQNTKNLIKMGSYFVGSGLETKTAPIYELAILFLCSLFESNRKDIKEQKALPSHLFKSLPIVSRNDMIYWLTNVILFGLKYVKQENAVFSKLNINRIYSFKLLNLLFEHFKPHDHQVTYLLEQICLQTKTFQIERVYVSSLANFYKETESASDIIRKYSELANVNYNIKGNKKERKVKPEDVRTELQDNEDSMRQEMLSICNKYIILVIFQKTSTLFEYSDKSHWSKILYDMEDDGLEDDDEPQMELNKEGEEEKP